jgi:hypothetical protein
VVHPRRERARVLLDDQLELGARQDGEVARLIALAEPELVPARGRTRGRERAQHRRREPLPPLDVHARALRSPNCTDMSSAMLNHTAPAEFAATCGGSSNRSAPAPDAATSGSIVARTSLSAAAST